MMIKLLLIIWGFGVSQVPQIHELYWYKTTESCEKMLPVIEEQIKAKWSRFELICVTVG